ncbi:unnamed protein product [Plutella xylostella]|uniref:Eukaryotic translation initiation factor 4 gamma 2 n=1 Tax=Plutella xylostella TaxID=51655 RepID=A0A8S4D511_PLUXY|nr:unnamed protein product [Plutella xylostella]
MSSLERIASVEALGATGSPTVATDAARGAARQGGGGRAPRRRWVPPGSRRDEDADYDNIFRKVRGILNKLTPEKFTKLSDDLLALDLASDKVLKGVILLIFEKALDEPKYSSMYAQLCKRLSEEAPDLEPPPPPGAPPGPCTFKVLLLNKCRTEFENRAQAFAAFEERALAPEELERRHLAKCKMLGNIKFIGELGKLEILSESILHRCIQQLLARRAAADHHEDLECLAQLVRTCGRVLDSERGRGLMDQYFQRIETLSTSRELQPRIRFMLRDVGELRRGGWVPRAATHGEGPVPIQQLRRDDEPPPRRPERERDALFRGGLRARPLDDVLAGLSLGAPTAALVPPPQDKLFGNGFTAPRDGFRQRSSPGYYRAAAGGRDGRDHRGGGGGKDPAPRFSKARLAPGGALEDVQMRPAANSLLFTANRLSKPAAPPPLAAPAQTLAPVFAAAPPLIKEPAITIKPANDKKDKPKKDKGLNKEEVARLALAAARAVAAGGAGAEGGEPPALAAAAASLAELQLPDKLLRRAVAALLDFALSDEEGAEAWACVALIRSIKRGGVGEAVRAAVAARHPHARLPRLLAEAVHQKLIPLSEAGAAAEGAAQFPLLLELLRELRALAGPERLATLYGESKLNIVSYVAEAGGGAADAVEQHGLSALVPQLRLQAELARQLAAEPAPAALYRWIKAHVEPAVRAHAAFVSALVALIADQNETISIAFWLAWSKSSRVKVEGHWEREGKCCMVWGAVPQSHRSRKDGGHRVVFINRFLAATALAGRCMKHVVGAAGTGVAAPAREAVERERALLEAYAPLLTALLERRPELQLAAVYAVQVHAHKHQYPKGMLLRWFMYLYNLEVCEEDAFLRWREDVTDAYPGKGEALFQVNTWLTWLQQQESEDEEAED